MNVSTVIRRAIYSPGSKYCRWLSCVAVVSVCVWLIGCSSSAENSRQQMHKLQLAMIVYATNHGGEWPDTLGQIKEALGGKAELDKLMKNPLTGDDPGYEYVKPKGTLKDRDFVFQVVLYQLRDGKRDTSVKVGYADGSVRPLNSK